MGVVNISFVAPPPPPFTQRDALQGMPSAANATADTSNCFATTVLEVSHNEEGHMDTAFLDTMASKQESSWRTSITLDGKDIPFKIGTEVKVTAISHVSYLQVGAGELSGPEKILYGPSRQPLPVIGQFSGNLVHKGIVSNSH